jgi:hypothetical protein
MPAAASTSFREDARHRQHVVPAQAGTHTPYDQ